MYRNLDILNMRYSPIDILRKFLEILISGNTQKTGQNPAPAFYSERKTKIHEWRRKKENAFAVATVLDVVVSCGSTVMQDYWLTNRADITRLKDGMAQPRKRWAARLSLIEG